jgi:hypothetical protein
MPAKKQEPTGRLAFASGSLLPWSLTLVIQRKFAGFTKAVGSPGQSTLGENTLRSIARKDQRVDLRFSVSDALQHLSGVLSQCGRRRTKAFGTVVYWQPQHRYCRRVSLYF